MSIQLNQEVASRLPSKIILPNQRPNGVPAIVHFGIGGFHRSHQAFALQRLLQQSPKENAQWQICGVCIRPEDAALVTAMQQQDNYYTLKMSDPSGEHEVQVINVIAALLHGPRDAKMIMERLASPETKVVSFTITEGGYNLDEATGNFNFNHPDIQHDLQEQHTPKTVFGYLSRALQRRKEAKLEKLVLLSCDNVQENGLVLRQALEAFVSRYDPGLLPYCQDNLVYPNSMVDRITPVTQEDEKRAFENEFGFRDECLVVSEQFFQWIIEQKEGIAFPPLEKAGVSFVKDVRPYERMKLGILNGSHSLVGLLGHALGYQYIFEAVKDPQLALLFDLYNSNEVIPTLDDLDGVDYHSYAATVKYRFGNSLIKDSVLRIIGGSTAKIPKFILPVLAKQSAGSKQLFIGALIVAAWWVYLRGEMQRNELQDVDDPAKDSWKEILSDATHVSVERFIHREDVFGTLASDNVFFNQFIAFTELILKQGMQKACAFAIDHYTTIHEKE